MKQEIRKFVPKLDYLTCPGWLDGPRARVEAGLGPGGPGAVVTDMGIFRFDEATGRMYLAGCYEGVSARDILAAMGFPVDVSRAGDVAPPTDLELSILRQRCDPQRLILD